MFRTPSSWSYCCVTPNQRVDGLRTYLLEVYCRCWCHLQEESSLLKVCPFYRHKTITLLSLLFRGHERCLEDSTYSSQSLSQPNTNDTNEILHFAAQLKNKLFWLSITFFWMEIFQKYLQEKNTYVWKLQIWKDSF